MPSFNSLISGSLLLLVLAHSAFAAEEALPRHSPNAAVSPNTAVKTDANNRFQVGELAQAATQTFARLENSAGLIKSITESLATMSIELDPFGYKNAFRTVGLQAEMLREQRQIIQALQQREIERLRIENDELRSKVQKLRNRLKPRNADSK